MIQIDLLDIAVPIKRFVDLSLDKELNAQTDNFKDQFKFFNGRMYVSNNIREENKSFEDKSDEIKSLKSLVQYKKIMEGLQTNKS